MYTNSPLRIRNFFLVTAVLLACTLPAPAQATTANPTACAECGSNEGRFPDATQLLKSWGFPPDEYTILLAWQERARDGSGTLITGIHLSALAGGEPFDLYGGPDGTLLTENDLSAYHIAPKNWDIQPVEVPAEPSSPAPPMQTPAPTPKSLALPKSTSAQVRLPALDLAAIAREDAAAQAAGQKGAKRIGVFQELPQSITVLGPDASVGQWEPTRDGGLVWTATLVAPDAKGQRIHFTELLVPSGGTVTVYNADNPAEAYGPYTGFYPGDSDLWTATCFGQNVVVECYVPSADVQPMVHLEIDRIVNIYTDFKDLSWAKAAGTCNLDVSCYPEWADIANGVGGIGTIGATGALWCTGTLLADTDPATSVPYFLTANHCVNTQTGYYGASAIEVYWMYQTDSCGGSAPSPSKVPRTTGGADLLAGVSKDVGTDFTLLRLRNAPPAGVTFVGWTSVRPPIGSSVVDIHHPSGDYKRISFGHKVGEDDYFNEVLWDDGTTEPGSSGSPLFVDGFIVGQLYGGQAACYYPQGTDFFGRFDVTYPLVESWLTEPFKKCDINRSGAIDAADVMLTINAALRVPIPFDADVDSSGRVDAVDIQLVINGVLYGVSP